MSQSSYDEAFVGVQLFWVLYAFCLTVFSAATAHPAISAGVGGALMFVVFCFWELEDISEKLENLDSEDDGPDTVRLEVVPQ